MHTPSHFARDDRALSVALMRAYPFATVIGVVDGQPEIAHLPMLVLDAGDSLRIAMHVARSNPMARIAEEGGALTVAFHGPHGYVSPSLYVTKPQVPTWNYAVVHVSGNARVVSNDRQKMSHVEALVTAFEGSRVEPWTMSKGLRKETSLQLG